MKLSIKAVLVLLAAVFLSVEVAKAAKPKLIVYTSMKESLISSLKADFIKKNPDIDMDYQSAGAGKLMAKIATEKESGKIMADIIWTSEVPDFYQMKNDGILIKYKPQGADQTINPLVGTDDYFRPARLGTLGIVYNTREIKNAPKTWKDLLNKEYKGAYSIANPALSGTSYVSVAMLQQVFGDQYFRDLRKNGAKVGKGSGQVVDDTASGELAASLGVDYITFDKIDKGATLAIAYPKEILMIPSPIAILKDTKALAAAKKFIDYMMSKDAQQIVADNATLPVRKDVKVPAKYNLPTVDDAQKNGIKVDYVKMMSEKEARVKSFLDIMQK
ncbi:MAG: ABC transporter substrate-binding protein [Endomicrobium sp.]|jgi:iron(III) transport system substrate-binding protein|nr:ABC transporter substrate-binding protein [Endomicrobium sp.]